MSIPMPIQRNRTSRSTVNTMLDQVRSPAEKRQRRAEREFFRESFRRFLKQVDRWKKHSRYLGVTFPGILSYTRTPVL